MLRWMLIALTALVGSGCDSPDPVDGKTEALKAAVAQAHRLFERTQTDAMANASFYGVHSMGGSGIHYLVASLPERGAIECYAEGKPSGPWCVVVRGGPGKLEITIDGYGAQLDRPVVTQVARLGEYRRF